MAEKKPGGRPPIAIRPGVGGGTSRSIQRRLADARFATRYFRGRGLDVGGGSDSLALYAELFPGIQNIDIWDIGDGDAQKLAGVEDESYDFLYSSHCLEHLVDPADGLSHWIRVVKPGGHLIVDVPDEDLYEQGQWPSAFNPDHKHTFTIGKAKSWSPVSIGLLEFLQAFRDVQVLSIVTIDWGHRYGLPLFDQTSTPVDEASIEFILRKPTAEEIARGGRLPKGP